MNSDEMPHAPKVTVLDESAEEARARQSRFAEAKAIHGSTTSPPVVRIPSARLAWAPVANTPYRPSRSSLVLRAAGVDELLLTRTDRVRFYSLGAALLIGGVLTGLLASYALAMLLPPLPGVILALVGVLCGLLNFFIDRSMVNAVLVRRLHRRHDLITFTLSLTGRVLLAFLAAAPTAYVLSVQIYTLELRELMSTVQQNSADALRASADLPRDVGVSPALVVLFTAMLVTLQLLPTIMAAFARNSLYARVLRADESAEEVPVSSARPSIRRGTPRGGTPQHRRGRGDVDR